MWPIYGIALELWYITAHAKPQGLGGNYAPKCEVRMAEWIRPGACNPSSQQWANCIEPLLVNIFARRKG